MSNSILLSSKSCRIRRIQNCVLLVKYSQFEGGIKPIPRTKTTSRAGCIRQRMFRRIKGLIRNGEACGLSEQPPVAASGFFAVFGRCGHSAVLRVRRKDTVMMNSKKNEGKKNGTYGGLCLYESKYNFGCPRIPAAICA